MDKYGVVPGREKCPICDGLGVDMASGDDCLNCDGTGYIEVPPKQEEGEKGDGDDEAN